MLRGPISGSRRFVILSGGKDLLAAAKSGFFASLRMTTQAGSFETPLTRDVRGQAILEFAITLPLLVVFIVGIYDFSGAFNEKQKIEQAAQEGAILAGAQPTSDMQPIARSNPVSLQPVVTAIVNSLIASGVVTSSCAPPGTVTGGANLTWTYTIAGCPGNLVITINRGWEAGAGTAASPAAIGTIVNIQYPYIWKFNSVIQLLIPGASYAATTQLTESATVHNQM
jgi:Flp pilus assembly protein TadG